MSERAISQRLRELAEQGVPADLDLWPAIRAGAATTRRVRQEQSPPTPRMIPRTSRRSLLVGSLMVLVLGLIVPAVVIGGRLVAPQRMPAEGGGIGGQASYYLLAPSLEVMVNGGPGYRGPDFVVQGRVTGATTQQRPARPVDSERPVPPAERVFTDFTVQVSEVVAVGRAAPPAQLTVRMMGGTADGKTTALEGLPLLEVGQEYLLFLGEWTSQGTTQDGAPIYSVGPQGYLRIAGGKVEPLVSGLPVVEELRGQRVDRVKQQIKAEKAKKP